MEFANKITKLWVLMVLSLFCFSGYSYAQIRSFSGKITDFNQNPLPGVTVIIQGTQRGTSSDATGKFTLDIQSRDIIKLTLIGYKPQSFLVGDKKNYQTFILEPDATNIEQVVVIGYSSKPQAQLSSSTATVSAKRFIEASTTNDFNDLLQAKVPGVTVSNSTGAPGATANIIIRGAGSLSGSTQPLYVVDGIINDESNALPVNPNDIASITVLKDGAATGIYGSRAANGVILVTTKKGKAGRTQISYTGKIGFTDHLKGNVKLGSSQDVYNYQREAYTNRWNDDLASVTSTFQNDPTIVDKSPAAFDLYLKDNFYPNENDSTTLASFLNGVVPPNLLNYNTDWLGLLFKRGSISSHSLSLSSGNEKTSFYTSVNYFKEVGTVVPTEKQDLDFRLNLSHIFNPKWKIDIRVNGGFGKEIKDPSIPGYNGVLNGIYSYSPWDHPYNSDGTLRRGDEGGNDPWRNDFSKNVLYTNKYNHAFTNSGNVNADFVVEYKPTSWLKLSSSNRGSESSSIEEFRAESNTLDAGSTGGLLTQTQFKTYQFITSNLVSLNKSFGKNNVSGVLGIEFQSANNQFFTAGGNGLPDGTDILNNIVVASYVTGNSTKTILNSYFIQADYNYDNKYFLVGSARRDGSSVFGPQNQYGNYYSVGGSWLVSQENFLSNSKTINSLKLRLSYATLGNASISTIPFGSTFGGGGVNNPSPYFGGYSYGASTFPGYFSAFPPANIGYNNQASAYPYKQGNLDLAWESNRTINIGFDLGLWNRVTLNIDAYKKINSGLLQEIALQATSGYPSNTYNIGRIRNLGLEINLNSINLQKSDFTWETNFNISFNRNKVLNLASHNDVYPDPNVNYKADVVTSEGHDKYSFLLIKYRGVDPSTGNALYEKWTDQNGDFIISAANNGKDKVPTSITTTDDPNQATLQYFGGFYPKFNAGLTNEFRYKGLSFSFLIYSVYGNKTYNWAARYFWGGYDGSINTRGLLLDGISRWKKPGDLANAPKIEDGGGIVGNTSYSGSNNSRFLEDGSFIRLKNVSISYDLPSKFLSNYKISKLQVFIKGDNLLTGSKFLGFDPEADSESADVDQRYPTAKKIIFGITLNF